MSTSPATGAGAAPAPNATSANGTQVPPVDLAAAFGVGELAAALAAPAPPSAAVALEPAAAPAPAPGEAPSSPASAAPAPVLEAGGSPAIAAEADLGYLAPDEEPGVGEPSATGVSFGAYWRGVRVGRRILLVAVLPLLVGAGAVTVLLLARRSPPAPWRGFVTATRPLLVGPASAFATVGIIERGEPVERLGEASGFDLVRDASGRVGYVERGGLSAAAPAVLADAPFTRCRRRPLEQDGAACERRGREQLDACRAGCPAAGCAEQCSARFGDCRVACVEPAAPAAAAAEPVVAPPVPIPPPAAGEVAADADEPTKPAPRKGKKGKKAKGAKKKAKRKA